MGDGSLSQDEIDALIEGAPEFLADMDSDIGDSSSDSAMDIDTSAFMPETAVEKPTVKHAKPSQEGSTENLDMLLDVTMNMTVELGRTKKSIKEVLTITDGSVVELNKLNGEPVDILVNGRLIARGEVVVIDESYGVKVTEVIDPSERFKLG